jgi:hypothetical protein
MRAPRRRALLMIAVLAASSPEPASAQSTADVEAARALFVEGAKRGKEGRWAEARQLYARSLALKPSPMTRYSLGVAQKETGHFADALGSFRAFLAEPSTPATAPYVGPARAAVAALERQVGRVMIAVTPRALDGVTVAIDGQQVLPTTSAPREIDPGTHEVVARAPGHAESVARFTVAASRTAEVTLTLSPRAATDSADPVSSPKPSSRTVPLVLMGTGGVLVAGGAVVGLLGVGQASDASTRDDSDASAARAKGIVGDVLGGVGLATVGAGIVLLLMQERQPSPTVGAVTPWVGASCAGIQLRL